MQFSITSFQHCLAESGLLPFLFLFHGSGPPLFVHKMNSTQQDYQPIAKQRWPGYTIEGNGAIAVVLSCAGRVVLVQTPIEASVLVGQRCKSTGCSHVIARDGVF